MSQASVDVAALGSIISNFFDGKADGPKSLAALESLGATIGQQIKTDTGQAASILGPQATAEIQAGWAGIQTAAGNAIELLDADAAPYMAAAAKAVEGGLDTIMDAVVPGGAALNGLVNGGVDTIVAGLKAALDAQAAAWKAKLAANAVKAATPA